MARPMVVLRQMVPISRAYRGGSRRGVSGETLYVYAFLGGLKNRYPQQSVFPSFGEVRVNILDNEKSREQKRQSQTSREGVVREGAVAQICHKLRAKFAQNCRYFVSYIRGRVRKIVANLSRISKSISDNFMQIPLFQCPLLQISDRGPKD